LKKTKGQSLVNKRIAQTVGIKNASARHTVLIHISVSTDPMAYHSTFVVFLSRDTLKKLSLKRKFCPRFRRGMGSFKEILMPKTIVFGKGELVFFLFHALRVAVGVDPYEYASRQWDQRCTQQDFSVGYGGFPFPSMSVGDDVHGVPLNLLPFSEEWDTASFSFLF
jgi:hypothetical protein